MARGFGAIVAGVACVVDIRVPTGVDTSTESENGASFAAFGRREGVEIC
jgi:hypothetical protein